MFISITFGKRVSDKNRNNIYITVGLISRGPVVKEKNIYNTIIMNTYNIIL